MTKNINGYSMPILRKPVVTGLLTALMAMASTGAKAPLSTNPDKFLGNIMARRSSTLSGIR